MLRPSLPRIYRDIGDRRCQADALNIAANESFGWLDQDLHRRSLSRIHDTEGHLARGGTGHSHRYVRLYGALPEVVVEAFAKTYFSAKI